MSNSQPQVFGKYLLIRRIAVGGMAEIFLARVQGAQGFQRDVVIKRILPTYSEDEAFVTMFIDEARIAARLHHPNIVQIYDFDRCDDFYYIAMEYVNGRDLRKVLDRAARTGQPITPVRAAQILADIAAGLKHAHEARDDDGQPLHIVHRDVSPHNIMLAFSGEAKILDFGIAKAAARSTRTRAGTLKGKCSYMSPEQARGRPLDGRSDLFALCAIGWEMLAGRRLFQGESDYEILQRVMTQPVPPPSSANPEVPPELDAILLRGLERDLDRRYPDMASLERDLRNFIFRHARGLEEVSVGPYLQDLFADELDRGTSVHPSATASPRFPGIAEPSGPARTSAPTGSPEPIVASSVAIPDRPAGTRGPTREPPVSPTCPVPAGSSLRGYRGETLPLDEKEVAAALEQGARRRPKQVSSPGPGEHREPRPRRETGRRGSRAVAWGMATVALLVVAGLGWWWVGRERGGARVLGAPSPSAIPQSTGAGTTEPDEIAREEPSTGGPTGPGGSAVEGTGSGGSVVAPEPQVTAIVLRGLPPGAKVRIDGRPAIVDAGGAVRGEWSSGSRVAIEVTADGHVPWREEVTVTAPSTEIPVRAEKATRSMVRPRVEGAERRTSPAPSVRATGRVSINAKPWADVYWKGRKIGTTPIRHFEVPVGRQVFVLRNQTASMELVIDVEENAEVSRLVELR